MPSDLPTNAPGYLPVSADEWRAMIGPSIGAIASFVPFLVPLQLYWTLREYRGAQAPIRALQADLDRVRAGWSDLDDRLTKAETGRLKFDESDLLHRDIRTAMNAAYEVCIADDDSTADAWSKFVGHALAGDCRRQVSLAAQNVLPHITSNGLRFMRGYASDARPKGMLVAFQAAEMDSDPGLADALVSLGVLHYSGGAIRPGQSRTDRVVMSAVGREILRCTAAPKKGTE